MSLKIKEVNGEKDLNQFIKLPWKIYKGNNYWVPPLISEVEATLDLSNNPFWEHAHRSLFLAFKDGEVVGRIAGIVDGNHNNFHNDDIGFFGFFECIEDYKVAKALYYKVSKWLRYYGKNSMRGPVNPSMNEECAFLLEGFDKCPTVMMPYTQPYYIDFAEEYGFKKAKDLYAFLKLIKDGIPERIERIVKVIRKRTGIKIRAFDMKNFRRDANLLKELYNSAWEKNWGFVPMTEEEMDLTASNLKQFADPDLVLFAEVDGKPVGVSVTIPDINFILKKLNGKLGLLGILKFLYYKRKIKGIRFLIGGVKKEYRNKGVIALLYYETEKAALKNGYEWCELGWNLEDNDLINKFDSEIGGKIYKKYRIYEKKLTNK